ncbi:hypothetical protein MG293_007890 [Ovis ammon polii]|uniref:Uncharacterized protein n=1 Tax=Ovis ammon polii TaxID=230172 RepID=A0AAD4UAM1_OVIAM|nr:hypothetical protein MG293_007890 [Ovis ammon polii]
MGRKGPGVCGCQCCNHGPHPGLGKGGVDFCLHLLKTYGLEGIFRANCHNISGSVSQAASEHLANGKSSPDSSWKPGYHAKAPPQLQGQDLRTAQTFGEQKEAGSLINHQFFRTAFLDFPNAPTSEFLLVFLHPLSRVHAEGLECVKLNSMICRLVFHSEAIEVNSSSLVTQATDKKGVQHDRGPCESSKTIPQRYKLQGSPAEGANSVILASLDDESSPLQSFGEGLPPPEQDIRLFRYLAPVFMWLVASAMVLSPEDLLSAEVVRPSQPLFLLLPLHGVLFCMTVDILLTSKPKLSPPTTKPSQIPQDQSRREVSLNLSQVARGLRGNMRICGWRLTSRAGSEQKRSLPESQPGCTWPEGKHEDLWLEARQPSQLGEKSRKANEKAVP